MVRGFADLDLAASRRLCPAICSTRTDRVASRSPTLYVEYYSGIEKLLLGIDCASSGEPVVEGKPSSVRILTLQQGDDACPMQLPSAVGYYPLHAWGALR